MPVHMRGRVMSFIVMVTDLEEAISPPVLRREGYQLVESIPSGDKMKHVFAWSSSYGVYLYWDENFISMLRYLSDSRHISGVMWDSRTGFTWFNSDISIIPFGNVNLNQILEYRRMKEGLGMVEKAINVLTVEEQALLCLLHPEMAGFFSDFERVMKAVENI